MNLEVIFLIVGIVSMILTFFTIDKSDAEAWDGYHEKSTKWAKISLGLSMLAALCLALSACYDRIILFFHLM